MTVSVAARLLEQIQSQDRQFLSELRTVVQRIARQWNWTESETAEDIAQDCLVKILDNLRKGKFEGRSSFKTYVYTIVRRTCIDYYRASRAAELTEVDNLPLIDPADSAETSIISREERRIAARVLLALPRDCRQLWRAIFFGRRNYRQAGELLGLKEGTVKRRMWECRQLAREKVAQLEK